ncbi:small acid-soluble spore protein H (minor) [Paenibacillus cellulosilyticus]|uniref:Small acid-soluble spore protein H (Minor) n=1 Tax=Paenibacillus cellulosilyticus TaxID=375489 RepID=A0A2V2Z2D2_9BACL|nr:H-type small acid-soluble spore protein [Paenibacillus cellulosilyticus]PWW02801.1 small acid-soluble spore protein H (minor) [Paenibacillus cellulosilyticus]QKS46578.1 H-type small acid-soluble spore protein [Paenibacillus cellulosilyticus]
MEAHRAKEIADSPDMIIVSYFGVPVFIEHVNIGADTARIHPVDNPDEEQTVPIDVLTEQFEDGIEIPPFND